MDTNRNLEIRARRALVPPFSYSGGYVYDANGHMVADQAALRVRGWGRFGKEEDGAELQDAVGERIAKVLTDNWNR